MADPVYSAALSRIHDEGFRQHARLCAPGIIEHLEPVRIRHGLVVEIGSGSGSLTRHLLDAGHRVIASDVSPAMLDLARVNAPDAEDHQIIGLPGDPIPDADAIVSTGHALSYLPTEALVVDALQACCHALRAGGVLAIDLEDLSVLDTQLGRPPTGWQGDDWALIIDRVSDGPTHFARIHTCFVADADGRFQRHVERHDNVLVDVEGLVRPVLEAEGLHVVIGTSFGGEQLMTGLRTVVAHRPT
ncbi:MAG: class I SAM-dependent methyltransferase [Actinomycetota bacterium]